MPFWKHDSRPDAAAVAQRLIALKWVSGHAMLAPRRGLPRSGESAKPTEHYGSHIPLAVPITPDFVRECRTAGIDACLTRDEEAILIAETGSLTLLQRVNATWLVEGAWMLAWALCLVDQMPPFDAPAPEDLFACIPSAAFEAFAAAAKLRDAETLDAAREQADLWRYRSRMRRLEDTGAEFPRNPYPRSGGWGHTYEEAALIASHTASQNGWFVPLDEDFPAKGVPYRELSDRQWHEVHSITVERQRALNWLCGLAPGNRWAETPTDTDI